MTTSGTTVERPLLLLRAIVIAADANVCVCVCVLANLPITPRRLVF